MTSTTLDDSRSSTATLGDVSTWRGRAPAGSDRDGRRRRWWRSDATVAVALGAVSAAVRLPLQSDFLVNFDSVNFALGMDGFDLERHEPHPPGYLGYVLLARAVGAVVGDANRSLTLLSVAAAGIATAFVFLLARRFADRAAAATAAALFAAAPLTSYYGIVGLSYLPGAAVAVALVWCCHRSRFEGSPGHSYAAGGLLAALGALRQTDLVLYAPLLWFATAPLARQVRRRVAVVVAAASVTWLVPLMVLSGGPLSYVEMSRDLAVLAGGRTSIFGLDIGGLARNGRLVVTGLALGLFAALIPLFRARGGTRMARDERRFLWVWVLPSLVVFLFVHTGQLGYVLPILPAAYLVIARAVSRRRRSRARPERRPIEPWRRAATVTALVAVDIVGFAVLPGVALDLARTSGRIDMPIVGPVSLPPATEIRPIDVQANDAHWRTVTARAEAVDPETSVILALPNTSVSFRHLAYYLGRDHRIYAVGIGRNGRFGHLFSAQGGETDYSVDGLSTPDRLLTLPAGVTQVLVFDLDPRDVTIGPPSTWERLDADTQVVTISVPPGATLELTGTARSGLGIDVAEGRAS